MIDINFFLNLSLNQAHVFQKGERQRYWNHSRGYQQSLFHEVMWRMFPLRSQVNCCENYITPTPIFPLQWGLMDPISSSYMWKGICKNYSLYFAFISVLLMSPFLLLLLVAQFYIWAMQTLLLASDEWIATWTSLNQNTKFYWQAQRSKFPDSLSPYQFFITVSSFCFAVVVNCGVFEHVKFTRGIVLFQWYQAASQLESSMDWVLSCPELNAWGGLGA